MVLVNRFCSWKVQELLLESAWINDSWILQPKHRYYWNLRYLRHRKIKSSKLRPTPIVGIEIEGGESKSSNPPAP